MVTDINKVAAKVKRVATAGSTAVLISNNDPKLRDGFEKAVVELAAIEAKDEINLSDALAIVQRIDPKALKSKDAQLYVSLGTVVLEEVIDDVTGGKATTSLSAVKARPIVKALREGVQAGLNSVPKT